MITCYVGEEYIGELPLDFSEITGQVLQFSVPPVIEPFESIDGTSLVSGEPLRDVVEAQAEWKFTDHGNAVIGYSLVLHFDSTGDYKRVKYIYRSRRLRNAN